MVRAGKQLYSRLLKPMLTLVTPSMGPPVRRRWQGWRRAQSIDLPVEREGPYRVAKSAALKRVSTGRDREVLFAIDLLSDRRRIGPEAGLELP